MPSKSQRLEDYRLRNLSPEWGCDSVVLLSHAPPLFTQYDLIRTSHQISYLPPPLRRLLNVIRPTAVVPNEPVDTVLAAVQA